MYLYGKMKAANMTDSDTLGFFQKFTSIVLRPNEFFENLSVKNEKPYAALKFFLIFGIFPVVFTGIVEPSSSAALFSATLGIAIVLLSLVITSALVCAVGRLAFKADLGYWRILRAFLYVYAITFFVGLMSMTVKYINPLLYAELKLIFTLFRLYLVYVLITGVSITGRISMLKAFASVFVPTLVFTWVIGGALYGLGVFSPPNAVLVDKSATGFTSFQINYWTLSAGDGNLELVLKNKYGEPITVTSVNAARVGSFATCNSATLGPPLAEDDIILLTTNEGSCTTGIALGEPYTLNVSISFTSPTGVSHTDVGILRCGSFPTCKTRAN